MKITIKTLTQTQFVFDIDETATVLDLKKAIHERESLGDPEFQKLIHAGKILVNEYTLASCKIKEGDFVVIMVNKPAEPKPATVAAPAPAAAASQAPSTSATSVAANADEATITRLTDMGFPRDQVLGALSAAFGNGDRAVEYLMNGIPSNVVEHQADPEPMDADEEVAEESTGGGEHGTGALSFLRNQAPFLQMRAAIQQNPQLLQPLLQQLGNTNPDLLHMLNNNQEEFLTLLNETAGEQPASGQVQIRATPEEKAAIDRLVALGFEKGRVIEAYFACDKDETLAANYLFDSNNWD
eukprot:CFRG1138T1